MNLSDYFKTTQGTSFLATSNSASQVDVAIYSRPHVTDQDTVAFIMRPRLTHENIQSNPHAAYMFIEKSPGYKGKTALPDQTSRRNRSRPH